MRLFGDVGRRPRVIYYICFDMHGQELKHLERSVVRRAISRGDAEVIREFNDGKVLAKFRTATPPCWSRPLDIQVSVKGSLAEEPH